MSQALVTDRALKGYFKHELIGHSVAIQELTDNLLEQAGDGTARFFAHTTKMCESARELAQLLAAVPATLEAMTGL